MPDLIVENHGSIVLLVPRTEAAETWLDENIGQGSGYQPYWPTVVAEPRYVDDILQGMRDDGLTAVSA